MKGIGWQAASGYGLFGLWALIFRFHCRSVEVESLPNPPRAVRARQSPALLNKPSTEYLLRRERADLSAQKACNAKFARFVVTKKHLSYASRCLCYACRDGHH